MKRILKKCLGIAMLCIAGNLHAATVANTDGYDVGSPKGTFSVSGTGAAVYNISIDVPNGGPLVPEIGVCYNSQSGNGLAGYGFNITGLMCITRGHKDVFHDNCVTGVKFNNEDVFLLDGKRLIPFDGSYGSAYGNDGSVYSPEGDPYTKVTMHNSASGTNCWFTIETNNGRTYEIGNSSDSRLNFTDRKNVTHTAAWYVNKVSDIHGNIIKYAYSNTNYCVRPVIIEYGLNSVKSRGITNYIYFSYNRIEKDAIPFAIGDRLGKIDVCLAGISTCTNKSDYRRYTFSYDNVSDGTSRKFWRLKQVDMKNGSGKSVAPIRINWNYLPALSVSTNVIDVDTKSGNPFVREDSRCFYATDINGDGVSDIIRFSRGVLYTQIGRLAESSSPQNYLFINFSKKAIDGKVSYSTPFQINIPGDTKVDGVAEHFSSGNNVLDFNGDGYNDLLISRHKIVSNNHFEYFDIFWGGAENSVSSVPSTIPCNVNYSKESPLYTTIDLNGDGCDDILYVEKKERSGFYEGHIIHNRLASQKFAIDETILNFKLKKSPEKLLTGDFNNDGLIDVIFFYNGGYKIYFNIGGSYSSRCFSEKDSKEGTNFGDKFKLVQGDFNGDGLCDFVFFQSDWQYGLALGNGDGTFNVNEKAIKLSVTNQNTNQDDNRFNMLACDFDHDGLCDFVITKANYEYHGKIKGNGYKNTQTVFVRSTGSNFEVYKDIVAGGENDAETGKLFVGDFYGDGDVQLASCGIDLLNPNDKGGEKIHVYRSGFNMAQMGRVSSVIDGLGCTTDIIYKSGTVPMVYESDHKSEYPVNTYTLPISVVFRYSIDNGAAVNQFVEYKYENAKVGINGKGFLGFSKITSNNTTNGISEETEITKWDRFKCIPIETITTSKVSGKESTVLSKNAYFSFSGSSNYFVYTSGQVITDFDGNKTETITEYDAKKRCACKRNRKK